MCSFVIFDEVGCGILIYDGLVFVWVVVEVVYGVNCCCCLFVMYYYEFLCLVESCEVLLFYYVCVCEWKGDLVLLYELVDGFVDCSYGFVVVWFVGVLVVVVVWVKVVFDKLEKGCVEIGGLVVGFGDLLLFVVVFEVLEEVFVDVLCDWLYVFDVDVFSLCEVFDLFYVLKCESEV